MWYVLLYIIVEDIPHLYLYMSVYIHRLSAAVLAVIIHMGMFV